MSPKIYREEGGKYIEGRLFCVVVYNVNYWLTELVVYADGMIDCWGLMNRNEFLQKLNSGWIRLDVPENSELYVELSQIRVEKFLSEKDTEDFIKEVDEVVLELSGRQSNSMICRELFKNYLLENSENAVYELTMIYNKLAKHKRVLFEYIDYKDPLVRLMNGEIKSFDLESRRYMLNDYFNGEWIEDQLK